MHQRPLAVGATCFSSEGHMRSILICIPIVCLHVAGVLLIAPDRAAIWSGLTAAFLLSAALLSPGRSFGRLFKEVRIVYLLIPTLLICGLAILEAARDYPPVQAALMSITISSFYFFGIALAHWLFRRLDPRLTRDSSGLPKADKPH